MQTDDSRLDFFFGATASAIAASLQKTHRIFVDVSKQVNVIIEEIMSASSKNVDVLPLSAANFDEVKRKISACASFEELRASMQEGGLRPEVGGASGQDQNQDGVSNGDGAGAGATSAEDDSFGHAWSQSFQELQKSYERLAERVAELDELNKMPREWTSENFGEMVTGAAITSQVVAVKANANELTSDLNALTTRLGRSWRKGVGLDMTARALSGDIIFQTRLRADSLSPGANLSDGDDDFVDFVELNCFRPLQVELQEKRVEALFQKLQQNGLVVDDALDAGGRSLLSGKVECDPMATNTGDEDRTIILSTFRAQRHWVGLWNPKEAQPLNELFDLRVRPFCYGSRSGLEFFVFAKEATFEARVLGYRIVTLIDEETKEGFSLERVRIDLLKFSVDSQDLGLRCVDSAHPHLDYGKMYWIFDCTEKRDAVYGVIMSAAELLLDTGSTSAITAAVTEQYPERFSSKIIDILDSDNWNRLAYLIDAGPHSLPVTNETSFLETVDFVNSPEFLEFHDLTDDEDAKKRLTFELRIVLKQEPTSPV